jgi:hypothetical protein
MPGPLPAAARRHRARSLRQTDMTITRSASADARRTWLAPGAPGRIGAAPVRDAVPVPQHRGSKRVARAAAAGVAVAALAAAAVTERAALAASLAVLGHLHWIWIPAAIALESASMPAFAIMLRRLLAAGQSVASEWRHSKTRIAGLAALMSPVA